MERLENNRSKVKIYHYSNCNFRLARSQKTFTLTKENTFSCVEGVWLTAYSIAHTHRIQQVNLSGGNLILFGHEK